MLFLKIIKITYHAMRISFGENARRNGRKKKTTAECFFFETVGT